MRSYVECAFDAAAMQVRVVEIGSNALEVGEVQQVAAELAHFAGAALVTVGGSEIIAAGKAIAALATNWRWGTPRHSLPLKPRAHIAVPVGMGLAEESTSLAVVDARGLQTIDDDRVAALSVIDDRFSTPTTPPSSGTRCWRSHWPRARSSMIRPAFASTPWRWRRCIT